MRCFNMVITLMSGVYEGFYAIIHLVHAAESILHAFLVVGLSALTRPLLTSPINYAGPMMPRLFSSVCFISFVLSKVKDKTSVIIVVMLFYP